MSTAAEDSERPNHEVSGSSAYQAVRSLLAAEPLRGECREREENNQEYKLGELKGRLGLCCSHGLQRRHLLELFNALPPSARTVLEVSLRA
jgi:hypothetical protein